MADELDELDTAQEADTTQADEVLREVHKRAMSRFDVTYPATETCRAESLTARRFVTIPGAMWEGDWGEQFANSIKVEVNKVGRGVEKIERDYRENRIVPDFRPDGKAADPHTANTLDGMHRADSYRFKSQQARDNGVFEMIAGGFGAYRLTTEWDDKYDKSNDHLVINPAALIVDADQCVFFDLAARLYDKSDGRYAFLRTAMTAEAFKDEFGDERATDWPEGTLCKVRDWFKPDVVFVAEYFEKEEKPETLHVLTYPMSGEERRLWASDMDDGDLAELKKDGWQVKSQRRKRCRVRKYILSGAEVLEDCGFIPGPRIPIVPLYGKRYFVDGVERWKGYVQDKMDSSRLYNSMLSSLAEIAALSPMETDIYAPEQIDAVQAEQHARANIDRLPFLTAHPLYNPDGSIAHLGPVGKKTPPQLDPTRATLLQVASADLLEDMQDADEVKANVSAEAMDMAATRVDAKSGIYLDNIRMSVQAEGEIYYGMVCEVVTEKGRSVDTMTEDGDDGQEELYAVKVENDEQRTVNNFAEGRYKVIVSVTEATATRRDKTVRSMLGLAELAAQAGDTEMSQAALITAALNTEGEGTEDFTDWLRQRALGMGLVKPNDEEKAAMKEAANAPPAPDPMADLANAQAEDFKASALKKTAEVDLTKAKTVNEFADAAAKRHQAAVAKFMPQRGVSIRQAGNG